MITYGYGTQVTMIHIHTSGLHIADQLAHWQCVVHWSIQLGDSGIIGMGNTAKLQRTDDARNSNNNRLMIEINARNWNKNNDSIVVNDNGQQLWK